MKKVAVTMLLLVAVMLGAVPALFAANPFNDISGTHLIFPHVATTDGWETEIAVLNPTADTASVRLVSCAVSGRMVETINFSLAPHGRYQFKVAQKLKFSEEAAYIRMDSEVFGLQGYTKFAHRNADGTATRASIMASGPRPTGLFTKIDHEGWTGIAFVNANTISNARVELIAYNDAGAEIAKNQIEVETGAKIVEIAEKLFQEEDRAKLSGASYVSFTSTCGLVGFFLNGSSDNTMLDGSQAL